jgi:transposase-like protein
VLTVGKDAREVERKLKAGELACPGCGGRLAPWAHARSRVVFGTGLVRWRLRPRRARCTGCRVTHVLLPASVLARHRDEAGVIGAALELAAGGVSCAGIARLLGRPAGLVRRWVRRLASRAGQVRAVFTVLVAELDPDPPPAGPAGSPLADAVAAIAAAAAAFGRRFLVAVSPWELASAVTSGSLLGPVMTSVPPNTRHVL